MDIDSVIYQINSSKQQQKKLKHKASCIVAAMQQQNSFEFSFLITMGGKIQDIQSLSAGRQHQYCLIQTLSVSNSQQYYRQSTLQKQPLKVKNMVGKHISLALVLGKHASLVICVRGNTDLQGYVCGEKNDPWENTYHCDTDLQSKIG